MSRQRAEKLYNVVEDLIKENRIDSLAAVHEMDRYNLEMFVIEICKVFGYYDSDDDDEDD